MSVGAGITVAEVVGGGGGGGVPSVGAPKQFLAIAAGNDWGSALFGTGMAPLAHAALCDVAL